MKCIDCLEDFTEAEKVVKVICVHCKGPMHAECAIDESVCENCQEDPTFGALLGRAGGVA